MVDIILEALCIFIFGEIIYLCAFSSANKHVKKYEGWTAIVFGLSLIFLAMILDITDKFPQLDGVIVVNKFPSQAFSEKFFCYLVGFIMLSFGFRRWLTAVEKLEKDRVKLVLSHQFIEEKYINIKTLHGIVPICSYCKDIRDGEGCWKRVEEYVADHTHAEFSHGICPPCMEKHHQNEIEHL